MSVRTSLTLVTCAALVHCSALRRPSHRSHDTELAHRATDSELTAKRPPRVRRWMEQPATKGLLLVAAGGISGAIAKTATAPLERAKLMSRAGSSSNFVHLMREVCRVEGWQGLWRGNTANVIRVVPNKGILLMCSDMYKDGVLATLPAATSATASSIAGGLAGLTAVLFTYPLELVRTRMAFRICDDLACAPYSSVWSTLRSVVASSGVLGLYAGVGMTLIGVLPFEGIKFGAYDCEWQSSNVLECVAAQPCAQLLTSRVCLRRSQGRVAP